MALSRPVRGLARPFRGLARPYHPQIARAALFVPFLGAVAAFGRVPDQTMPEKATKRPNRTQKRAQYRCDPRPPAPESPHGTRSRRPPLLGGVGRFWALSERNKRRLNRDQKCRLHPKPAHSGEASGETHDAGVADA